VTQPRREVYDAVVRSPSLHNGERDPSHPCVACGGRATGGKPYCFAHVDRMPFAAAIAAEVDRREREARRGGGPLLLGDARVLVATEGVVSVAKLRATLMVPERVVRRLVADLVASGGAQVKWLRHSKRKIQCVVWTEEESKWTK
jgi:hypothetical protein